MKNTLFTLAFLMAATISQAQFNITSGHADIGVGYGFDGEWDMHWHAGNSEFAPNDAKVVLSTSAQQLATGAVANMFGVTSGTQIWRINENPGQFGVPFLGFAAEETEDVFEVYTESDTRVAALGGNLENDWVTFELTGFNTDNGGNVFIWKNSDNGLVDLINTSNGLSSQDKLFVPDLGHTHYNLGFTRPGTYDLVFTVSGIKNSNRVHSPSTTYRFDVQTEAVPEPTSILALGSALVAMFARKKRNLS
jgi:surface-anchored protein